MVGAAVTWARIFGVGPFHVLPMAEQRATYGEAGRQQKPNEDASGLHYGTGRIWLAARSPPT